MSLDEVLFAMILIPDDPIIACIERTGYPPWIDDDEELEEEEDESF